MPTSPSCTGSGRVGAIDPRRSFLDVSAASAVWRLDKARALFTPLRGYNTKGLVPHLAPLTNSSAAARTWATEGTTAFASGTTSTRTRARPRRIRLPMPACSAMRPMDPGTREMALTAGAAPLDTIASAVPGGAAAVHGAMTTVGAAPRREGAAHHEGVGRAATARRAAATARRAAATAAAAAAAPRGSGRGRGGTTWARTARQ
jgi:hypothetical protein